MFKVKEFFKILLIIVVVIENVKGNFPQNLRPCNFRDTRCIQERINYFLNSKYAGDGFINLPKIDPLSVPLLNIQPGPNSPVNIDLIMKNNLLNGLKDAKAISVSGFDKDLSKKHELKLQIPLIHMTGDYNVKGQVIVLPVEGVGKHDITLNDVTLSIQFTGSPYVKNGRTYMKIENLTGSLTPKKVVFNFDNLFNGDKVLTNNVNVFINENWLDIFNEIHNSLLSGLSPVLQKILNDVFSKLPYDEFFAKQY